MSLSSRFCIVFSAIFCIASCLEWYDSKVLYQIYPKSFADSNGDGVGDLKGITSQVGHFTDIGVGAVWLSPIFKSPMKDNGYDISSYYEVNSIFGTLDDLKELIKAFHEKGLKVLLDLVPNHTSDEHQWFKDSVAKKGGKDDYYIWVDATSETGGVMDPPNNWMSLFGGSAWTYHPDRKQFYFHQFGSYQPDLNFRNPKVVDEMKAVMRYWLDLGVDGFRVDAVPHLFEDKSLESEYQIPDCKAINMYDCMVHNKTKDQPENFDLLRKLGTVLDEEKYKAIPRKLFLEAYSDVETTIKYYSEHATPFNFQLMQIQKDSNASQIADIINNWMNAMPVVNGTGGYRNVWVIGNHDNTRVGSKMGEEMIDAMNMLVSMAPGNTVTYYGEEIGMVDTVIRPNTPNADDRAPERTPMQWNDQMNAGFSRAPKTWLPVNPNYWQVNNDKEMKDSKSHLSVYKKLVQLQNEIIEVKDYSTHIISPWIFGLKRSNYLLLINLDDRDQNVNLTEKISDFPSTVNVKIASLNSNVSDGDSIASDKLTMRPRSAVILSTASSAVINTISSILLLFALILIH